MHGLRHDEELAVAAQLASTDSAPFVHRDQHGLAPGSRADVVLLEAANVQDALLRTPRRELVLAGGRVDVEGGELVSTLRAAHGDCSRCRRRRCRASAPPPAPPDATPGRS